MDVHDEQLLDAEQILTGLEYFPPAIDQARGYISRTGLSLKEFKGEYELGRLRQSIMQQTPGIWSYRRKLQGALEEMSQPLDYVERVDSGSWHLDVEGAARRHVKSGCQILCIPTPLFVEDKHYTGYDFWDAHWTPAMKDAASRPLTSRHASRIALFKKTPSFRLYTTLVNSAPDLKATLLQATCESVFPSLPSSMARRRTSLMPPYRPTISSSGG
jgi:hypothetical protein